jgi:hypothetical protein
MLTLLLTAAVTAKALTALDAERDFAADAQRKGQWTAFRDWADPTAVMFEPQAVWVQQSLKDRRDPPRSVAWRPAASFVSCDGRTAVNTGTWRQPGTPASGSFATVWMKQASGDWRWIVDSAELGGGAASVARPRTVRASCANRAAAARAFAQTTAATAALTSPPGDAGQGRSADGTLAYRWIVSPNGARRVTVRQWTGRNYRVIIDRRTPASAVIAAPAQP